MPTYAQLQNADSIEVVDIRAPGPAAPTFTSGAKADTISEITLNNGVVVDGVTLKDSCAVFGSGFGPRRVSGTYTATGSTQGTAAPISTEIVICSIGGAGTGLILPVPTQYMIVEVLNLTGAPFNIYPAVGAAITGSATGGGGVANAPFIMPAYRRLVSGVEYSDSGIARLVAHTTTLWYVIG